MRFEYTLVDSLPRLAWCARIGRGQPEVEVIHGPWVETTPGWFVEGAWDGPFKEGGFDNALILAGTGGIALEREAHFATPSHMYDRLQSLRIGAELLISNSIPFLMAAADDEPDPRYRFYFDDLVAYRQAGLALGHKPLRTHRGRDILLHDYCALAVGPDLILRRVEKPAPPEPKCFADVAGLVKGAMRRSLENASDPARVRRRYAPLATLSRGYDSVAVSALLRQLGGKEALTFVEPGSPNAARNDDGSDIGRRLGLGVIARERNGRLRMPGAPEAEFLACPNGLDIIWASVPDVIEGRVLVTGMGGDFILGGEAAAPSRRGSPPPVNDFARPNPSLPGASLNEFRLRVGFFHYPAIFAAAGQMAAVRRISVSPEMKPWSVGGDYDRPIARRIAEEAGIPRECFARRKISTPKIRISGPEEMSPGGRDDFLRFVRELPPMPLRWRAMSFARTLAMRIQARVSPVHRWNAQMLRRTELDFGFHWGYARIRDRYRLPSPPG